jgi:hypothetical protein
LIEIGFWAIFAHNFIQGSRTSIEGHVGVEGACMCSKYDMPQATDQTHGIVVGSVDAQEQRDFFQNFPFALGFLSLTPAPPPLSVLPYSKRSPGRAIAT